MARKSKNIVVKAVTFVLFGLLIASFAVWGIGDIFRAPSQVQAVAEVGEREILTQDYARALSREVNRISAGFGSQLDMEQARALGIPDQVLNQMIGRALFDLKARDLGLVVTDDQIKRLVWQQPAFHNSLGEFDRGRFEQQLRALGMSEAEYVETLRRDITRQQISGAVAGAAAAPDQLAEALYRYRREKRVAQVLTVPNDSIDTLPEPDEAALQAFHKEFSDRFMAPEYREISLIELRAEDLAAEISVSEEELRAEFETRFEELVTPERRTIAQMVFQDRDAARQAAERLAGGADFAETARQLTGEEPVDLGMLTREDLPPELADAAFALAQGATSAPVESPLGWHVLRVAEIAPREEPTFEEIREELRRDTAMHRAVDSMVSIANQLDDELASGATLEEAAGRLDLPLRRIPAMDGNGRNREGGPVADLPGRRVVEVAFETEAGRESLLTETAQGDYFILRVDSVTPAQLRPLEVVREEVVELWRDAQRAKLARERAEELAGHVRAGAELEALAADAGLELARTEPITRFDSAAERTPSPALAAKLFQIQLGEVTTASAPDGHLLAKLVEIQPADPAADAEAVEIVRNNLAQALRGDLLEQFMAELRSEFGVTVNERALDDLLATF